MCRSVTYIWTILLSLKLVAVLGWSLDTHLIRAFGITGNLTQYEISRILKNQGFQATRKKNSLIPDADNIVFCRKKEESVTVVTLQGRVLVVFLSEISFNGLRLSIGDSRDKCIAVLGNPDRVMQDSLFYRDSEHMVPFIVRLKKETIYQFELSPGIKE